MQPLRIKKKTWVEFPGFFLFCLLMAGASPAFSFHYHWSPGLKSAYQKINLLQLDTAAEMLRDEKRIDPENLVIPYLEDYIFFYTYYITEDKAGFDAVREERDIRLSLLEQGPEEAPEYYQFQAEVLLHWAMVRAKFDERYSAAREINQAFRMLRKNESRHSDHMASLRVLHAIRAGFGSLPKGYQWIIQILFSLEGTIDEGLEGLNTVLDYADSHPEFLYGEESLIISAFVYRHFANQPQKGLELLLDHTSTGRVSPIMRFAIANTAQAAGENETVIHMLEQYDPVAGELRIRFLDYMLGKAKLYRNDADADQPLKAYVHSFQGMHFIKEAYQKLAWHALINGNEQGYAQYMRNIREEGEAMFEGDKQALEEAEPGNKPHPGLLKARLLYDGGYDDKALMELNRVNIEQLSFPQKLEYTYRSGRIYQAIGDFAEALGAYQRTIREGQETRYYFACNAALQSGLIHEELGNDDRAIEFFERCLSLHPSMYENSLHQKAKMAINRIRGK